MNSGAGDGHKTRTNNQTQTNGFSIKKVFSAVLSALSGEKKHCVHRGGLSIIGYRGGVVCFDPDQ